MKEKKGTTKEKQEASPTSLHSARAAFLPGEALVQCAGHPTWARPQRGQCGEREVWGMPHHPNPCVSRGQTFLQILSGAWQGGDNCKEDQPRPRGRCWL